MLFKRRKMSQCILPLAEIEISAWPEQNFLFGLLLMQETGEDWIMNQFIQLRGAHYMRPQYGAVDFSVTFYPYGIHQLTPNLFDFCPFINKYTLPRSFVAGNYGRFHEFVRLALDNGYYLSTFLDQFFREDRNGQYGFRHPNFIYGYDDAEESVYLADNFERGKYGRKKITYSQLDRAFELVPGDLWEVSVFLYKVVPYRHSFYTPYIKEQIADYLNPGEGICYFNRTVCQNPSYHGEDYTNEVFFGIECYQLLLHYLNSVSLGDSQYPDKDWRSFVVLVDHKHLMVQRYEYMTKHGVMSENKYLYEALVGLEKDCMIAQNMFIKYTVTEDEKILQRLIQRIKEISEKDICCMEQFADNIL